MDPAEVWERLRTVHQSQGLGSAILTWKQLFMMEQGYLANKILRMSHFTLIQSLARTTRTSNCSVALPSRAFPPLLLSPTAFLTSSEHFCTSPGPFRPLLTPSTASHLLSHLPPASTSFHCRRENVFSWVSPDVTLVGLFQLFVGGTMAIVLSCTITL